MKKLMVVLACLLLPVIMFAQEGAKVPPGEWTFEAYDAPYPYSSGSMKFEKGDAIKIVVVWANNAKEEIKDVKVKGDQLVVDDFNVQGYLADVYFTYDEANGTLKGHAYSEGMEVPITFKKKIE